MSLFSNSYPFNTSLPMFFWLGIVAIFAFLSGQFLPQILRRIFNYFGKSEFSEKFFEPYKQLISLILVFVFLEFLVTILPIGENYSLIEFTISLVLTALTSWLISRISVNFLDFYILDVAIKSGRKANSDLLLFVKAFCNFVIVVVAILVFAQTHSINVIGLLASLGIGGLAVAFAAQKTLEQFLGGVVLYLDQPFTIDDYIGLPDGIFGRVESIGWRSTKIRTSGKGTVMIIPNNALTQMNIENFSGAKKVMSILNLTFYREMEAKEQALIRQVILASTNDIFGLDSRSTDIAFKTLEQSNGKKYQQGQITFFILSSGEVSMELRRQLLDIARQQITYKLKDYGIEFDIDDPIIYVDAPITI